MTIRILFLISAVLNLALSIYIHTLESYLDEGFEEMVETHIHNSTQFYNYVLERDKMLAEKRIKQENTKEAE